MKSKTTLFPSLFAIMLGLWFFSGMGVPLKAQQAKFAGNVLNEFSVTNVHAQPEFYRGNLNEGFEGTTFPPLGWKVINGGDANTWVRYATTPITGTASAAITYGATAHDDWLITPKLAPDAANATFSFKAKQQSTAYIEKFNVKLSTTGNDQANFTVTLASEVGPAGTTPETFTYDLSAYIGQQVYVAIQAISTDQFRLYVDDVTGPPMVLSPTNLVVTGLNKTYSKIPKSLLPASFVPAASVMNSGEVLTAPTNVSFTIEGTSFAATAPITVPLETGATQTVTSPTPWNLGSLNTGTYNIKYEALHPTSNQDDRTDNFELGVTEGLYARDADVIAGGVGSNTAALTFGMPFEIPASTAFVGAQIKWPSGIAAGDLPFQIAVYEVDDANAVLSTVFTSSDVIRTQAMGGNTVDFPFSAVPLPAGRYILAVKQLTATNISMGYDQTSYGYVLLANNAAAPTTFSMNNSFGNITLRMLVSSDETIVVYPAPRNLTGVDAGLSAQLNWEAPILNNKMPAGFGEDHSATLGILKNEPLAEVATQAREGEVAFTGGESKSIANRDALFTSGPFINGPGQGAGGADISYLHSGLTGYGANVNQAAGYRLADDFVVTDSWNVESFTFYGYQTGSTTTSTMTAAYLQIWDGVPGEGGQVIYGDMVTNVMTSTQWTNSYRVSGTDLMNTQRPIMAVTASTPGLSLTAGTYWVDFALSGSLTSGPWGLPITITGETTTGNAKQYTGTAWQNWLDGGTSTQHGVPFVINGTSGGGTVVNGPLVGYKLLRNGVQIATPGPEALSYLDTPLEGGSYTYSLSAVYGEPYAGESNPITTTVNVVAPSGLPFIEDFSSGGFTANGWTFDPGMGNWSVTPSSGNPSPAAQFGWTPTQTNYSFSMVSKDIIATNAVSNVTLEIDINLNDYANNGNEKMKVYIWDGSDWVLLETIANTASIPWTTKTYDVTAYALGKVTKVKIEATGLDTYDINYWYIDNIKVFEGQASSDPALTYDPTSLTETHFVPPSQETTQVVTLSNTGGSDLTWELTVNTGSRSFVANTPEDYARLRSREQADGLVVIGAKGGQGGGSSSHQTRDAIIRHDNGVNDDAIGLTSGGTFHVAARFPASFMGQYSGMKLNQVEVYINDVPSPFVLKVYGQGTATSPGTILYQQTLVPQGSSWNLITLDTPVDITGQDLWIGYTVTHAGGQYPAGCDAGPHVTDGDWISTDGTSWSPLNTLAAIDVNWNIAGYLIPGVTYAKDVGVHSLVSPASGANLGDEQVIVKVKNYGTEPQSNISVSYTFNGGSPVTATIPGPLAGGATLDYTFAGTVNLGTPGQSYTIQACATVTGDENTGNDCKTFTVTHVVPVYCDATTGTQDEYISRVQLGTIDNSSGWQGGVADYTDQYTEMAAGSSGEITVTNGNPWSSDKVTVWVDWNKDYTFETGGNEQFVLVTTNSAATFTGTIAVPAGTPDGLYRMRIRMTYSTAPLPCGNASYGEVEDYSIKVTGGAPPTPWLSADVTSGTIPAGGSTQITVTFNSASLSVGSYTGSLDITSNDPVNSSVSIPVTLNVEESDVCYPSPRNLTGTSQNQNVTLTWQVPDFTGGGGGGGGQTEDFYEGFEAGTIPTGWTVYDVDGDTYNWENTAVNYSGFTAHTGLYCMTSASYVNYVGPLTPNNWLVTPGIKVTANSELKFWVSGQDPNYAAEKYYVKVSTTGNTPADFGSAIFTGVATGSYEEKVVNLSSYAGQTIYIAFQHTDVTDQFYLNLDDVTVTNTETRSAYTVPVTAGISQAIPFRTSGMSETEINAKLHPEFVYVYGESSETTQPGGTVVAVAGGIKHMSGSGTRELLYDNGPFVNSPGTGPNGTDQSVLQNSSLGMTTYGAGVQFSAGNRMADDFVVTDPWEVESFTFYTYQTGSTTTSTITGAYVQVWNGDPTSGGQVVWGDLTTNVMSSTAWTNAYRMSETDAGTTRPVMSVTCATPGLTLQPGTYWVDFTLAGSLSSGPWAPPITITGQSTTGNSKQYTSTGWGDFVDGGTSTAQGVPFLVEGTISGGGDECPHGELLGYNVYRGNQKIGETVPSVRTYIDSNVTPGTYVYGVTAVYGEPYPGESDPVTTSVTVSPAATFPFEEDWTSGNFTANNWTFDPSQGNWGMNSTTGNPAPSARFGWSPSTTNYSYSLISKDIAANLAVSNVTLQFDIMLDNYTNTGAEQIKVYIWNGSSWVLLETIANTGDIPWTTKSYDVTAQALGKTTKVRFEATGANTFDIDYWYLDNIKVFEGQPAQNPVITVTPAALQYWVPLGGSKTQPLTIGNTGQGPLNWTANIQYLTRLMEPEQVPGGPKYNPGVLELSKAGAQPAGAPTTDTRGTVVLHYDGDNDDAIGLTSGGSFHVAARFPSDMVAQYSGYVLQSVDVYINDVPNPSTLYIWGAGSANAPGAVLHQQNFTGTAASWNTITLSTPLTLTGQDIWVGYSVTHAASEYPAGCDAGPANPNGDWISTDGSTWAHLAGYGLDYNWNIRALISGSSYSWLTLSSSSGTVAAGGSQNLTTTANSTGLGAGAYYANILISSNDPVTPVKTVPAELHVGVGIEEDQMSSISVYPVPATQVLNIKLVGGVKSLRVLNYMGQVVDEVSVEGMSDYRYDVSRMATGAYTLQFINQSGSYYNKTVLIGR